MCLYFLIKAFLYNYYKNWAQLMKFMLSKTYKLGFERGKYQTNPQRNAAGKILLWLLWQAVSRHLFRQKTPSSRHPTPSSQGSLVRFSQWSVPPPPFFFLFLIIFIKCAWIYNIILFLACAFLIAETNQTYLDGFPKGVCSRFVKTVLFFFGQNGTLCCFLFSFCWINCASYGIWFEGFLPIWWFL